MERKYKRRLIVGKYPNRFSHKSLNFFLVTFLVFFAALFGPMMLQMELGAFSDFDKQEAASKYLWLQSYVWPPLLLAFMLLVVGSAIFTHRIAGPLYRFMAIFRALAEGDLSVRAMIRKGDYLHQEAEGLNQMIQSLETKFERVQEEYKRAAQALAELADSGETPSGQNRSQAMQRLQQQMEQLRAQLELFTVTSRGL